MKSDSLVVRGSAIRLPFSFLFFSRVLNNINLRYCRLGDEGKGAILDAVSGREGFKLDM